MAWLRRVNPDPEWWRGLTPPTDPGPNYGVPFTQGRVDALDPPVQGVHSGLPGYSFFRAEVVGVDVDLSYTKLVVQWSTFDGCRFGQRRKRPVANEQGFGAQGCFGNSPSIYRDCAFDGVIFKGWRHGFSMGRARFENCTFRDCRWEGHFAHEADLIGCTFVGRMNGCVWRGGTTAKEDMPRRHVIRGNDFTQVLFGDNVAWRDGYPVGDQIWPDGYGI